MDRWHVRSTRAQPCRVPLFHKQIVRQNQSKKDQKNAADALNLTHSNSTALVEEREHETYNMHCRSAHQLDQRERK